MASCGFRLNSSFLTNHLWSFKLVSHPRQCACSMNPAQVLIHICVFSHMTIRSEQVQNITQYRNDRPMPSYAPSLASEHPLHFLLLLFICRTVESRKPDCGDPTSNRRGILMARRIRHHYSSSRSVSALISFFCGPVAYWRFIIYAGFQMDPQCIR